MVGETEPLWGGPPGPPPTPLVGLLAIADARFFEQRAGPGDLAPLYCFFLGGAESSTVFP